MAWVIKSIAPDLVPFGSLDHGEAWCTANYSDWIMRPGLYCILKVGLDQYCDANVPAIRAPVPSATGRRYHYDPARLVYRCTLTWMD